MNPSATTVLNDRYALTERIAAGGMGEVWAATDTVLGRTVAVKLLNPALSQERGFLERFRAEARCSAALHHPNITTVFDSGLDDGCACLVMEFIAGQPPSQLIFEHAPLSAQTTASILIQAATALQAAHQGGVVHRGLKPANILITPDGTAKLTDFGISRLVNTASLTQTGHILGAAQYLSPAQVLGHCATASGDIDALGVLGHEMLTGQRPFDGDTSVATAVAHLNQPSPHLPDTVPVRIRHVIIAALAKDPADHPATAATMAHALGMPDAAFASGAPAVGALAVATLALSTFSAPDLSRLARTQAMPATAMPTEPPGRADRRSQIRPAWLLAGAAAGALLVLAAFALPGSGNGTHTSVSTASASPTPSQVSATKSTGTTSEIAPSEDSSMPAQPSMTAGRAGGHDQNKDGKK